MVLSQQQAYTPALQLAALNDMTSRLHLSPRHLLFASVTDFYMDFYSFIDPEGWKAEFAHWLTHNGQFTLKVVTCPTISQAQDRESLLAFYHYATPPTTINPRTKTERFYEVTQLLLCNKATTLLHKPNAVVTQ